MSKSKTVDEWRPTAPRSNLALRAHILKKIRNFFEDRHVLEVDTPLLCHSTATDPALVSFETFLRFCGSTKKTPLYLQTSPEYPMKRLLAAGYGSIYQICKAFRNGEIGTKHNPEFTILEWYRIDFTHFDLMNEVDCLLAYILKTKPAQKISYLELFDFYFSINPHTCSPQVLIKLANRYKIPFKNKGEESRDLWLDLLLTHIIEPELGLQQPVFIYDYPHSQAALAKVRKEDGYSVGERFETYFKGMELANGYHELGDPNEQLLRFKHDNKTRRRLGLPIVLIDKFLINALSTLPHCAGVALGLDRLICLSAEGTQIADVIAFPILRA